MNKKDDIDKIKDAIRQKIQNKSLLVFKHVCNSDIEKYREMLNGVSLKPFQLSRDEIRKVDKIRVVNGKKTWLYKIVIEEMANAGEIVVSNSYCTAPSNSYAKSYPLTANALLEIKDSFQVEVNAKKELKEWTEDDPFIDPEDQLPEICTKSHKVWLNAIYSPRELKRAEKTWNTQASYVRFCKTNSLNWRNSETSNRYIYEGNDYEAIAKETEVQ